MNKVTKVKLCVLAVLVGALFFVDFTPTADAPITEKEVQADGVTTDCYVVTDVYETHANLEECE